MRIQFPFRIASVTACCLLVLLLAANCGDDDGGGIGTPAPGSGTPLSIVDLSTPWEETSPASVGAQDLSTVINNAENLDRLTSLLVVHDGRLIVEEYFKGFRADSLHDVRSVTKTVVGLLVGQAILEGFIGNVDDPVHLYLEPEFNMTREQEAITIRHLLQMSAGFDWRENNGNEYREWIDSNDHVEYVLNKSLVTAPGEAFTYNSAVSHLLGVILSKAYNKPLDQIAEESIFNSIGITNANWESLSGGYFNGGAGMALRSRDLARIGQLMLQNGQSGSRQVVERAWIDFLKLPAYEWRSVFGALTSYTYGGQLWVNEVQGADAVLAWGAGGQFIYIMPEKKLVIVTTANWINVQSSGMIVPVTEGILDLIINQVIPRMP